MKRDFELCNLKVWELASILEPDELAIILFNESNCTKTDIMLENMLDYFLEEEMYEFAVIIRDEVERRKPLN